MVFRTNKGLTYAHTHKCTFTIYLSSMHSRILQRYFKCIYKQEISHLNHVMSFGYIWNFTKLHNFFEHWLFKQQKFFVHPEFRTTREKVAFTWGQLTGPSSRVNVQGMSLALVNWPRVTNPGAPDQRKRFQWDILKWIEFRATYLFLFP